MYRHLWHELHNNSGSSGDVCSSLTHEHNTHTLSPLMAVPHVFHSMRKAWQCYSLLHEGESASLAQGQALSLSLPAGLRGTLGGLSGSISEADRVFVLLFNQTWTRPVSALLACHHIPYRQISSVRRARGMPWLSSSFYEVNRDKHFEICMFTLKVCCKDWGSDNSHFKLLKGNYYKNTEHIWVFFYSQYAYIDIVYNIVLVSIHW